MLSGYIDVLLQKTSLGVLRSDYLLDRPNNDLIKQVEINTVSTSLSAVGYVIVQLQRCVLSM